MNRITPPRRRFAYRVLFVSFIAALCLVPTGCWNQSSTAPPLAVVNSWKSVPALSNYDIRYMVQQNGTLFIAAVNPRIQQVDSINGRAYYAGERGLVYETTDGAHWKMLKGFYHDVGPLAFHNDTLYCFESDSIYRYLPDGQWQVAFKTPDSLSDASTVGDIVFLRDTLYAMRTGSDGQTWRIPAHGTPTQVLSSTTGNSFAGTKFLHTVQNGKEIVYMRGYWATGGFYQFSGSDFIAMNVGLTGVDLTSAPTNSMAFENDTLFAGFLDTGRVKVWKNNGWVNRGDTLPASRSANLLTPFLRTAPTAIAFRSDTLYVATQAVGVLRWNASKGWVELSSGLPRAYIDAKHKDDLYAAVPMLESFGNYLIAGYGLPACAPWGNIGLFVYSP